MKRLRKGQRGFTLIELLIAVALAGIIAVALTAITFQVFSFSARASNQMTAIRQVQQAGFWVSPDVMMADPSQIHANEDGNFLVLRWTTYDGTVHEVHYVLETVPSTGVAMLMREHYTGPDFDSLSLDSVTAVAEYIDPDPAATSFLPALNAFDFTVTANVGGQTETRTYEVQPRIGT